MGEWFLTSSNDTDFITNLSKESTYHPVCILVLRMLIVFSQMITKTYDGVTSSCNFFLYVLDYIKM